MKYIIRNPSILFCFLVVLILGVALGNDLSGNFISLYAAKLTQQPVRYILLLCIILMSIVVYKTQECLIVILRRKNIFHSTFVSILYEMMILVIIFVILNIPIILQNFSSFKIYFGSILLNFISSIVVSVFILSIIKVFDLLIKNRTCSSAIIFSFFAIFDTFLSHLNYFVFDTLYFDMSSVFCLSFVYRNILFILFLLAMFIFVLISAFLYFKIKCDYLLVKYEED